MQRLIIEGLLILIATVAGFVIGVIRERKGMNKIKK